MTPRLLASLVLAALALAAGPAFAERADRDKPVNIEADRGTVDDRNKVNVFEGSVVLTQGTLVIKGDKLVVTQDADGFQKGVATGSAKRHATIRQKREGRDEYIDGEAERIEYDSRTERAKLFNNARVTSGGDEVRGSYIEYDALSENYVVNNAPGTGPAQPGGGRVRAVIQPKNAGAAAGGATSTPPAAAPAQ
jgi:lipopolysaccharide export system protein LptA